MMRILVDNDVVLDFILKRPPFDREAKELFVRSARKEIEIYVCALTPTNSFYTIRKERDLPTAQASVIQLLKLVQVSRVDMSILEDASMLGFSDYEDAVQCASAMAENLDAIVTPNAKDFKNSPIPVYSPTEFLDILRIDSSAESEG